MGNTPFADDSIRLSQAAAFVRAAVMNDVRIPSVLRLDTGDQGNLICSSFDSIRPRHLGNDNTPGVIVQLPDTALAIGSSPTMFVLDDGNFSDLSAPEPLNFPFCVVEVSNKELAAGMKGLTLNIGLRNGDTGVAVRTQAYMLSQKPGTSSAWLIFCGKNPQINTSSAAVGTDWKNLPDLYSWKATPESWATSFSGFTVGGVAVIQAATSQRRNLGFDWSATYPDASARLTFLTEKAFYMLAEDQDGAGTRTLTPEEFQRQLAKYQEQQQLSAGGA